MEQTEGFQNLPVAMRYIYEHTLVFRQALTEENFALIRSVNVI